MTYYLKYRPKNLDELDSESVAEALKKIVLSKAVPHAFLFSGPKGTGKTSAARILAKILLCENLSKDGIPCEKCDQCKGIKDGSNLDVIELDAASHRGIDDIRVLRDAVKLSPVKAPKKIYIIDEAHMLTTEASNALLKTLEEPPEHVVFILATTNPEKLIDTIRSRTTVIPFKKATEGEIIKSLKRVSLGEGIEIGDEALGVVAKAAKGAFRDAIKILEQIVLEKRDLSPEMLFSHLFSGQTGGTKEFIRMIIDGDVKNALLEIKKIEDEGGSIENFTISLLNELRTALLAGVGVGSTELSGLSRETILEMIELFGKAYKDYPYSPVETLPLEIAVIRSCTKTENAPPEKKEDKKEVKVESQEKTPEVVAVPAVQASPVGPSEIGQVNDDIWKNILSIVRPINASIEALLRAARPMEYDGTVLTLGVYYKFHKERLEDLRNRRILEDVVTQVLGSETRVICMLTEPAPTKIVEEAKVETVLTEGRDADIIKVAEEIFGN
jgi:DNA polymerase III subunit gamma/tau